MALSVAVQQSRLHALRELRDRLAVDLDECGSARDVAALSQRLMDVLAQIDSVEKAGTAGERTALDELAARRKAAGRADAAAQPRASRGAK